MTISLSVESVQKMFLQLANFLGPATVMYLTILIDSRYPSDNDWFILFNIFAYTDDPTIIEEASHRAMVRKISDMSKFEKIVKEVEAEFWGPEFT